jgi:predicted ABC-type ATPase
MKELILLRGLPGSGKSTVASIIEPAFHYEADMYFIDENGDYHFDGSKLKEAHQWCKQEVESAMNAVYGSPPHKIVVSNTFTQEWEMEAYYKLAEKYGYRVSSLIVENRHGCTNVHGVPEEKIDEMFNRFELKL